MLYSSLVSTNPRLLLALAYVFCHFFHFSIAEIEQGETHLGTIYELLSQDGEATKRREYPEEPLLTLTKALFCVHI